MMPESEENRLDQSLRDKFEDFNLTPGAPVWAGIEQRLPPPPRLRPRRRPVLLPLLWVLTALVAGLGGWLLPHGPTASLATNQPRIIVPDNPQPEHRNSEKAKPGQLSTLRNLEAVSEPRSMPQTAGAATSAQPNPLRQPGTTISERQSPFRSAGAFAQIRPVRSVQTPADSTAAVADEATAAAPVSPGAAVSNATASSLATADALPPSLRPLAALERRTLEQLPGIGTLAPGTLPADGRAALLTNLRTERAELFRLQRRTDSLLLALGDLPGAAPAALAVAAAAPDTARPRPLAHRWSVMLSATPEQNTLALQGPENDSLTALRRNHETGRAGLSAALTAEYRLTPRLSVGGGVGYTAFGADLRITNKTTDVLVSYNTTTTTSTNVFTSSYQTHSIRVIQVPQLSPIFNGSGQVIRYDTVYVPRQDTVFSTTVQHDTTHTTRSVTTPTITKKETLTTKLLQPNYRFFTVPVLLRYRLAAPGTGRLWTDVAVGAQLQFFLGGTQVVTNDGENFRTERITASTSPFRAINVALAGSLALNYALTPRLSLSVAPSMRWQALSLYKPETGLRQQATSTGLMFGVRFGL
ncbi:hypothetical protein KB206_15800 [Microvirga sp. STS02]|uniref:hypothetical protein n=1 Tax=Hymenobacter negativus TaxID=2795026 RepID=UPI0018DC3AA0|nr:MULTISPECIES: hypothetical protein [Bacteria]MBH8570356.1 hypothetical protein [Hymenobacter negativus]MBR7210095.1 hypothetical protein [Microvirga sp. STS02]